MKKLTFFVLVVAGVLILCISAGCSPAQNPDSLQASELIPTNNVGSDPDPSKTESPIPPPTMTEPSPGVTTETANADVTYVKARRGEDGLWTFSVTVTHPDTGWEDYADGWDVVLADGSVLKPDPASPFTRLLLHPHVEEQPFTRSQSRIRIPEGETQVLVRAHDLLHGFGGQEILVDLTATGGPGFEVENPLSPLSEPQSSFAVESYTYQNPGGNRWVEGQSALPHVSPVDIALNGPPEWVLGAGTEAGIVWIIVLADGAVQGFLQNGERIETFAPSPAQIPPGSPPVVRNTDGRVSLLATGGPPESVFSHPVHLGDSGVRAAILEDGHLELASAGGDVLANLDLQALPDSRVLQDNLGRLLVVGDTTSRYAHGVLGDKLEGGGLYLISPENGGYLSERISVPGEAVIEGQAAIWTDVDQDQVNEILVTLSDSEGGARLVLMSESGQILAESDPIGTRFRWLHQIAVGPFGSDGEWEIVSVRTPHLGGIVEFHRRQGDRLVRVAQVPGYSSHLLGSRNLDMAAVGDFDSDGKIEILVPTQSQDTLGAIRRTDGGAELAWNLPLEGMLSTNLAVAKGPTGLLSLAVGLDGGRLRIWPGEG